MNRCPASALTCRTTFGELVISGWTMHAGSWCALDLSELLEPADVRGESVLVPRLHGRSPRPLKRDEREASVPFLFSGAVDRDGVEYEDHFSGLDTNRREFVDQVVAPLETGDGTRPLTVTLPDATVLEADATVLGLSWEHVPLAYARAVLSVRLPDGELTVRDYY